MSIGDAHFVLFGKYTRKLKVIRLLLPQFTMVPCNTLTAVKNVPLIIY